ncbi:hypothetical protein [Pedobacter frigidisoli]|uniref:hypothetical protein n=1 Tax=Pedobacter frigidisoli TaxID=2530455 RepID=UPI00292CFB10|nr:hypothetical protein [Pedobacter frigidisoli]
MVLLWILCHFEITISDELDADTALIAPVFLQPFVENAIEHGSHGQIIWNRIQPIQTYRIKKSGVHRNRFDRRYSLLPERQRLYLLAKATVWAATEIQCANQAFNISNADLFRWNELWPKIAAYFGLQVAPPFHKSLQTVMADKELLWTEMSKKYSLKSTYGTLSSWPFGDAVFSWDYDFFADGTKARRFGFQEFIDTEKIFYSLFDGMKANKIIP